MVKPLNLSFMWHMHQPDYRDGSGIMRMPWVFLHSIKDYYDMPWIVSMYPALKATFNVTPPLIEQINLYKEPTKNDYFLSIWIKHPSEVGSEDKKSLIKTCKSSNYETMVRPLERFDELYHQVEFNDYELIDLEVMFMLSWCGVYLRKNNSIVLGLMQKGRNFTQEDKQNFLDELTKFVQTILPFYTELQKSGQIAISTTPYNHPILPLLIDMSIAREANPHAPIVDNFVSLKDDAKIQVERAIELYKETFKIDPIGFWPAEGAVDEASSEIYRSLSIKWIATDEAILFKSLKNDDRANLYHAYKFNDLSMGFRDHGLSDLIGFTYRFYKAEDAVEHFLNAIKPIAHSKADTAFVILDGENAWEFFHDNAYPFFTKLYERLNKIDWCRTVTMDEVANGTTRQLDYLAPGSWINGDFTTWSGSSEKNRAWELVFQTRRDYANRGERFSDDVEEKIKFHFLAAECSDWYWWYGDDHHTDFALEFDTLFRKHLIEIYDLMKMTPPADLFGPILEHKSTASFMIQPQFPIRPKIDGNDSSFFEWIGAGTIDESKLYSTMDRVRGPIAQIHYGQDEKGNIYTAFQGDVHGLIGSSSTLRVIIEELEKTYTMKIEENISQSEIVMNVHELIEIYIERDLFENIDKVHLRFEIEQNGTIVQTLPGFGALAMDFNEDYGANWFI